MRSAWPTRRSRRVARHRDRETLAATFIRDTERANALSRLSRCETAIERSLYRALHELERLRTARKDGEVRVIDVIPSTATD